MESNRRLVHGFGINDIKEPTQKFIQVYDPVTGKNKSKQVWRCPFYDRWKSVLERALCKKLKSRHQTYQECTICEDWKYFSNFKRWMQSQDWKGKQLDKDLLIVGNKHYSPETCCFVDRAINTFILNSEDRRGSFPLGVTFHRKTGKFEAQCNDPFTGKRGYIGLFNTPEEAHEAWRQTKERYAIEMAKTIEDKRVAKALVMRYQADDLKTKADELNELQEIQETYS